MKFIADLHVHSKYSIATAKNLDLENLYIAAQKKGITVVGTGDFTHPGWMTELKEKLIPSEPGLFRLKKDIEKECDQQVPSTCRQPVRFLLTAEISNIYKKKGKTRKNHNLILAPDLSMVEKFNATLDRIGNIKSDGRPILGLDTRNLLEMLLDISDRAMFIPAHIWTPWFSLLGSKSGFDTVEECFEDLSKYIFAVETGLSSDPAMNWRVSDLDRMTLISNSDAHSPMKLGREANLFNTDLSYGAIRGALMKGDPEMFKGTLEFFPEEGKYHLDGHRKCGVRFTPEQTIQNKGICPVCGKPMTIGVLYRVEALADKEDGRRSPNAHPYQRVVPLVDILSQVLGVGSNSKKVQSAYQATVSALGDELSILIRHPIETIEEKTNIPLLGEAIRRMRAGHVEMKGGYDGEFGTIRIFEENEKARLMGQKSLFADEIDVKKPIQKKKSSNPSAKVSIKKTKIPRSGSAEGDRLKNTQPKTIIWADINPFLNPAQRQVVEQGDLPLIIAAGPGTGKTMTITGRMAHLIKKKKVSPRQILAVTFTNKASEEMHTRLKRQLPQLKKLPMVTTFHAFCLDLLRKRHPENPPIVIDETDRDDLLADAVYLFNKQANKNDHSIALQPGTIGQMIMTAKQKIQTVEEINTGRGERVDRQVRAVSAVYHNLLAVLGVCDYEDLIFKVVKHLESDNRDGRFRRPLFRYVFVDEYQDINEGQYRFIRAI
ncbi:MAG: UvrD-helicase domain-containing protein, partial [Thermodesulfobacteriota bacterium]|nr:UvrD-helicase domain-containing protein [Thermodesulfobacteriota bacterium]